MAARQSTITCESNPSGVHSGICKTSPRLVDVPKIVQHMKRLFELLECVIRPQGADAPTHRASFLQQPRASAPLRRVHEHDRRHAAQLGTLCGLLDLAEPPQRERRPEHHRIKWAEMSCDVNCIYRAGWVTGLGLHKSERVVSERIVGTQANGLIELANGTVVLVLKP
jgi:hypothetical protein